VQIFIVPTRVQGAGAAQDIARAIRLANRIQPPLDVLVVGRGGGSVEDLWSFNEEAVVRAIVASGVPVVSAVGHEIDVTLADLAADVRALTPSEAAERVIPSAEELSARLSAMHRRMLALLRTRLVASRRHVEQLANSRILRNPKSPIYDRARRIDELDAHATRAIRRRLASFRDRLSSIACRAEALSPLAVLARGYSVTAKTDGTLVRSIADASRGDALVTRVADGQIASVVS
jgi:exodeoxyribonuclease VII large subunit